MKFNTMKEKFQSELEQERAWAQSLACDPAWEQWNQQLNKQMNEQHQQEQDDGPQHTQL